jgi:hypothetical protein
VAEQSRDDAAAFDPFAEIEASPRGATPLAVLAAVLGVLAVISGLAAILGPIGMAVGLVAHVKGSRFGMPATVLAALGMIVGFSLTMYLR